MTSEQFVQELASIYGRDNYVLYVKTTGARKQLRSEKLVFRYGAFVSKLVASQVGLQMRNPSLLRRLSSKEHKLLKLVSTLGRISFKEDNTFG